jgi:hypothetical protein
MIRLGDRMRDAGENVGVGSASGSPWCDILCGGERAIWALWI